MTTQVQVWTVYSGGWRISAEGGLCSDFETTEQARNALAAYDVFEAPYEVFGFNRFLPAEVDAEGRRVFPPQSALHAGTATIFRLVDSDAGAYIKVAS